MNKATVLKMECDTVTHNKQQLQVRFIIPVSPVKPGQAPTQATTILQLTFANKKEASEFLPGSDYEISIAPKK